MAAPQSRSAGGAALPIADHCCILDTAELGEAAAQPEQLQSCRLPISQGPGRPAVAESTIAWPAAWALPRTHAEVRGARVHPTGM